MFFQILEEERYYLCQYLDPANYFAYLRSKFIINEDDQALIESKIGRKKKAEQMIDILLQKGGESYDVLTKAIQLNKTQNFMVEKLQKEYEKRKSNYMGKKIYGEPHVYIDTYRHIFLHMEQLFGY